MTDDLISFLGARLKEDEHAAQTAAGEHGPIWKAGENGGIVGGEELDTGGFLITALVHGLDVGRATTAHIARHDPARVRAEVDAKRSAIARISNHSAVMGNDEIHGDLLRLLAQPYASHPDYREEWRP
ncbi:DUF6221 family protein [Streptomyces sioyaensis]|uniref:DUF6221 family protein n=1 Tax=Streptomyces sioyaensis TaxID=67364 RepID=UPI003D71F9B0